MINGWTNKETDLLQRDKDLSDGKIDFYKDENGFSDFYEAIFHRFFY